MERAHSEERTWSAYFSMEVALDNHILMFPDSPIASITNGVHSATWTAPSFAALYDRHIPD